MPELPEVQTVVSTLAPVLPGRRIIRVVLSRRDIVQPASTDLPALLTGRSFASIARRGKRIVITLDDGNRFYIHLGMTGRLTLNPPGEEVAPHTHLLMELGTTSADHFHLRFRDPRRFGGVWWLGQSDGDGNMGPEPLTLRTPELARRLARTRRPIKNALLDQSLIAGLGNIYVDESLHAAGIHPLKFANELTPGQIAKLNRAIKSTLRRALRHRGSTLRDYRDANGAAGAFQKLHRVYDRAGKPCKACKTAIERIVLGGRSTCFCPQCQPKD